MGLRYAVHKLLGRVPAFRPSGKFYSIEQVCERYRVPVVKVGSVNDPAFVADMKARALDLVVSVAAPQIFKPPLIAVPRLGCINVHNSKLPKYRGMLPNFWQMYNSEPSSGTTVHRINAALDDGAILMQEESPMVPNETLDALICRTKRRSARLMMVAIRSMRDGTCREMENPKSEASYYTFPTRSEVAEFRRRGFRIL
jgi:methionyl-tRNA formyltransferase